MVLFEPDMVSFHNLSLNCDTKLVIHPFSFQASLKIACFH